MPGEAEFVDLTEVDDLDVGERVFAVDVERVVVGEAWKCLTPPGRVAQPADHRCKRQDRRPGLERRPLDSPDLVRSGRASRAGDGRNQTASGMARMAPGQSLTGRWMKRSVMSGGGSRCCKIWICWKASPSGTSIAPVVRSRRSSRIVRPGDVKVRGRYADDQPEQKRQSAP